MELPTFKYHPDPVATGNVEPNPDRACLCCSQKRGFIYTGPAYSEIFHYLSGALCPWCIADGSAAKKFRAVFTDTAPLDGISNEICNELETRTPGFNALQQEQWLTCCDDAAAYLGAKDEEHRFRCLHCANVLSYNDLD